uniref:Uncharacterized protein n=1 Tax=Arundo donax TaxID=35708 RepID=A0A0A9G3X0_ARUDO
MCRLFLRISTLLLCFFVFPYNKLHYVHFVYQQL